MNVYYARLAENEEDFLTSVQLHVLSKMAKHDAVLVAWYGSETFELTVNDRTRWNPRLNWITLDDLEQRELINLELAEYYRFTDERCEAYFVITDKGRALVERLAVQHGR